MDPWDAYRIKAAELRARARTEVKPELATEFERLAHAYLILAEMAVRNNQVDIVYETPIKKSEDGEHA